MDNWSARDFSVLSKIALLLLGCTMLINLSLIAQEITPEQEREYDIETFVLPGGRLGNNVNSIVQGPNGFMRYGSHGGVHRYDGHNFVTYKNVTWDTIGESSTLTFPYVELLYWDSNDMLWVSTYGNGLYRFDPNSETFKHYAFDVNDPGSISHSRVVSSVEDLQGRMWFGTVKGLNRFDAEKETFIKYFADTKNPKMLRNDEVRKLYVDKQGVLWIGSGFAGFDAGTGALSRYHPEDDSFTNYFNHPGDDSSLWGSSVRGLLKDSQGNFWVGTGLGLCLMDRKKGTFY